MKKILVLLLLLIALTSTVFTEEIDCEIYMPRKLILSELPEDYPIELEELYRFYYIEYMKLLEIDVGVDRFARNFHIINMIKEMPSNDRLHYLYLIWLSKQKMPIYSYEYKLIFGSMHSGNHDVVTKEKLDKFAFNSYLLKFDNKVPFIGTYESMIGQTVYKEYPELVKIIIKTWLKGEIIEMYDVRREVREGLIIFSDADAKYLKVKILESIGNEFEENEVILSADFSELYAKNHPLQQQLQVGQTYLFSINVLYSYSYTDEVIIDGKVLQDIVMLRTSVPTCYKIEDGIIERHNSLNNQMMTILNTPSNVDQYDKFFFGDSEEPITYESAKQVLEEPINFLKRYKDVVIEAED